MSKISLGVEYEAIATASDSIEAGELLFRQTLKLLELADKIAYETESLRAISTASQLRKDAIAMLTYHQAFISRQALIETGEWEEMKTKFNVDLFVQNLQK